MDNNKSESISKEPKDEKKRNVRPETLEEVDFNPASFEIIMEADVFIPF